MDISILLAKIMGLYLLVSGLLLLKKPELSQVMKKIAKSEEVRYSLGLLTFFIGLALVSFHTIWDGGFRTIVTILSWLVLVKGFLLIWPSEKTLVSVATKIDSAKNQTILGVAALVLGFYLTYVGFFI